MSTYCISDIHGHRFELELMLDKISFCDSDDLYILGDLIDKGPESAELLLWAVEDAPNNVHFLKGNHEDLMYSAISYLDLSAPNITGIPYGSIWGYNDGGRTFAALMKEVDNRWLEYRLLPWVENLPLYKYLVVRGKPFMLVHGGFNPNMYTKTPKDKRFSDMWCDGSMEPNADRRTFKVGHGFGEQTAQNMLWERETWIEDTRLAPCDTVFGHTYLRSYYLESLKEYSKRIKNVNGGSGRIGHIMNKHGIDCGCARAEHASDLDAGLYNLACLRLDDMKEFYVPCRLGYEDSDC